MVDMELLRWDDCTIRFDLTKFIPHALLVYRSKDTTDAFVNARITIHNHFIFFAFSLMVSSLTNIPFPLYGSGFLHILIFAAN